MASTDQQNSPKVLSIPESESLATMNDIPNELLPLIFKHLSVQDLIRCRLVCERFMWFCDEIKITELLVCSKIENIKEYWFHTNEQFNRKDTIDISTFIILRSIYNLDVSLKRLYFEGSYSDLKLLDLNRLQQLEQLRMDMETYLEGEKEVIDIHLPNVKILELSDFLSINFAVFLNTPKLQMLKCCYLAEICLTHPNTITHLETDFHYIAGSLENLQYLKVNVMMIYTYRNILTTYPKLTTLISIEDNIGTDAFNELYDLLVTKHELERKDFKIYFQSVEITDESKLNEYDMADDLLGFQIKNYDNLRNSGIEFLDYNDLMHFLENKLPQDFHRKYFDIRMIKVTEEVENVAAFLQFLKGFEYLKELQLETSFDQCFYDSLPEVAQLTALMVQETDNPISDYSFLFKLRCLRVFETDRDSQGLFDLSLALFSILRQFRRASFYYQKEFISIDNCKASQEYRFQINEDLENGEKALIFKINEMDYEQLLGLIDFYKFGRQDGYIPQP